MAITDYNKGKMIGKGFFSKVYEDKDNPNHVIIISWDPMKCALTEGIVHSDMLPKAKCLGYFTDDADDRKVFRMKRYSKVKAPSQELSQRQYRWYQELRRMSKRGWRLLDKDEPYFIWRKLFSKIKDYVLRKEMLYILDSLANYGSDICFEISPRNIAVGPRGKLILLDCFLLLSAL